MEHYKNENTLTSTKLYEIWNGSEASILSKLRSRNVILSTQQAQSILRSSLVNLSSTIVEAQSLILEIMEIRYGLEPERIGDSLLASIVQALTNSREPLSLDDLKTCFEFTPVQKIPGQKMTLDEFMTPIRQYITTKQMLKQVVLQQHIENTKQVAQDEAEEQFFLRAKQKYIDSLEFNEWMGTMFEAKAIADKFWRAMTKAERDDLLKHTADIYYREKAYNDQEGVIPKIMASKKHYLAHEAIKHACKNGMQW
jgi:hypothetical protein